MEFERVRKRKKTNINQNQGSSTKLRTLWMNQRSLPRKKPAELSHQALWRKQHLLKELHSTAIRFLYHLCTLIGFCLWQVMCKTPSFRWWMKTAWPWLSYNTGSDLIVLCATFLYLTQWSWLCIKHPLIHDCQLINSSGSVETSLSKKTQHPVIDTLWEKDRDCHKDTGPLGFGSIYFRDSRVSLWSDSCPHVNAHRCLTQVNAHRCIYLCEASFNQMWSLRYSRLIFLSIENAVKLACSKTLLCNFLLQFCPQVCLSANEILRPSLYWLFYDQVYFKFTLHCCKPINTEPQQQIDFVM